MRRHATAPIFATEEHTQPIVLDTTLLLVRERATTKPHAPPVIRLVRLRL